MTKKQKKMLIRIIVSAILMITFLFIPMEGALRFCVCFVKKRQSHAGTPVKNLGFLRLNTQKRKS